MYNALKAKRKSIGLTQIQFAEKIGISERAYKRYESDKNSNDYREPNVRTAIKIAKTLGTTVENLWDYELKGEMI